MKIFKDKALNFSSNDAEYKSTKSSFEEQLEAEIKKIFSSEKDKCCVEQKKACEGITKEVIEQLEREIKSDKIENQEQLSQKLIEFRNYFNQNASKYDFAGKEELLN